MCTNEAYTSKSSATYRPDIDGLRSVAVLAVVGFHAFPDLITGGFIGVDVFFVISGYLISTIIFQGLDNSTFSIVGFYGRRIRRIFPALLVVLGFCFALGWLDLFTNEFDQLTKYITAGASFVSNLIAWNEAGYFDNSADSKPLLHLWSLGIEEQFYIVWPVLCWLAWRRKFNFLILTLILGVLSFALNVEGIRDYPTATFYSPLTRFWELLSGSALAWMVLYKRQAYLNIDDVFFPILWRKPLQPALTISLPNILSFVGAALLVSGFWVIDKTTSFPGVWALVPVSGAMLIILAGADAFVNRTILSSKVAVCLGLISYPLYLWHWPLLSFTRIIDGRPPHRDTRIIIVALSILLAWATYSWIERPIRFGTYRKSKTAALLIAMVALGAMSGATYALNIAPKTMGNFAEKMGRTATVDQIERCKHLFPERNTLTESPDNNICALQKSGVPNVAMIGDSMNESLFPGLAEYDDYNIVSLSAPSAAPLYNTITSPNPRLVQNNYKLTNQALDYVANADNIKVVILSSIILFGVTQPESYFKITDVNNRQNTDAHGIFVAALDTTIKKLMAKKKSIIFALPYPILRYDIGACTTMLRPFRIEASKIQGCSMPVERYRESTAAYREWVKSVLKAYPQVAVFDASLPVCDATTCYGRHGADMIYRDVAHLNVSGSRLVAPSLHDLISKLLASHSVLTRD